MCGFDEYIEGFDVHHVDPVFKDFNLSKPPSRKDWNLIEYELRGCVLLCATCHRGVHAGKKSLPLGCYEAILEINQELGEYQ